MFLTNQRKFKKPKSGLFAFPPKIIIYISWENFFVHKTLILTYLKTHISNLHSLNKYTFIFSSFNFNSNKVYIKCDSKNKLYIQ